MFLSLIFVVQYVGSLETAIFSILDISVDTGAFPDAGQFSVKDIISGSLIAHAGAVAETKVLCEVKGKSAVCLESSELSVVGFL